MPDSSTALIDTTNTKFGAVGTTTPPVVFSAPQQDTQVTFTLPTGSDQGFVVGELHLRWQNVTPPVPPVPPVIVSIPDDTGEAEQQIHQVFSSLTPQQMQTYQGLYSAQFQPKHVTVTSLVPQLVTTPPPRPSSVPTVSTGPATRKLQRDSAMITSLCVAVNGQIPGYAGPGGGCQGVPPVTTLSTTGAAPS